MMQFQTVVRLTVHASVCSPFNVQWLLCMHLPAVHSRYNECNSNVTSHTCNFKVPSSLCAYVMILAHSALQLHSVWHYSCTLCSPGAPLCNMFHLDGDGMLWDPCAVFLTNIKHDCSKAEIKKVLRQFGCDGTHYMQYARTNVDINF